MNDFDETLPGPFEYDVKRMAASFTIAARNNGFSTADRAHRRERRVGVPGGDGRVRADADDGNLVRQPFRGRGDERDSWQVAATEGERQEGEAAGGEGGQEGQRPQRRPSEGAYPRQPAGTVEARRVGRWRVPHRQPTADRRPRPRVAATSVMSPEDPATRSTNSLRLPGHAAGRSASPAGAFRVVDVARKVVGVGSVGTRAFIVLLQGRDAQDPLFLQVKEATASVLEDHLPKSRYKQHGERVVQGQRMMQAASDIFLGWTRGVDVKRNFYWRQLRDMKGSALVEAMAPLGPRSMRDLWVDPGAGACPVRRSGRHLRVPRRRRRVRPIDHRLLRALRRSERPGLPGLRQRNPVRPTRSAGRHVTKGPRRRATERVTEQRRASPMSPTRFDLVVVGSGRRLDAAATGLRPNLTRPTGPPPQRVTTSPVCCRD